MKFLICVNLNRKNAELGRIVNVKLVKKHQDFHRSSFELVRVIKIEACHIKKKVSKLYSGQPDEAECDFVLGWSDW